MYHARELRYVLLHATLTHSWKTAAKVALDFAHQFAEAKPQRKSPKQEPSTKAVLDVLASATPANCRCTCSIPTTYTCSVPNVLMQICSANPFYARTLRKAPRKKERNKERKRG